VGEKGGRGRWLRLRSYSKERWASNSKYLGETKLQATSGARGVNGQRLAQDQSVDVKTSVAGKVWCGMVVERRTASTRLQTRVRQLAFRAGLQVKVPVPAVQESS
jgi:hypothetical protein